MSTKKEIMAIKSAIAEFGFVPTESPYELSAKLGEVPGELVDKSINGVDYRYGNMVRLDLGDTKQDVPAHRSRVFEREFEGGEVMVGIFISKEEYRTSNGTVIPKGKKAVKAYVEGCLV